MINYINGVDFLFILVSHLLLLFNQLNILLVEITMLSFSNWIFTIKRNKIVSHL